MMSEELERNCDVNKIMINLVYILEINLTFGIECIFISSLVTVYLKDFSRVGKVLDELAFILI